MRSLRYIISATAILMMAAGVSRAQDGFVSAGFETNSIYYVPDQVSEAVVPDGSLGSNNYMKVDFGKGMFEGGLQIEDYLPSLQGYPNELHGYSLANKYLRIRDKGFTVTVGDYYDQFGSGLLFRAYEERSLGINTAVEGVHFAYNYNDAIIVKALVGRPKLYMTYNDESRLAGADLSVNIARLAGLDAFNFSLEGSFFNKHQALENEAQELSGTLPDVNGYSARAAFDWNGLTLKGEYVARDADATVFNLYNTDKSRAILAEAAYSYGGLGVNLTFRKLANAAFQSDFNQSRMFTMVNYVPALTQQHSYSLAALNPYQSQLAGELGGQADVYYFFPRKTLLGGSKGMRTHANFSTYYGPRANKALTDELGNELYFRDLTVDAERWWGKNLKTIVLYTWQTLNNRLGAHPSYETWTSHTIVADATYKFNSQHSLRAEYQHLWTAYDKGNWMAATIEYSIAPSWSFSFADMWNYGSTRTHYFNGGVSYSHSRTRCSLNFGRFKEGFQCAGGVCRLIPAYTGANLSITTSF